MTATWPAELPTAVFRRSLAEGKGETRRKSETDRGPGKVFPNASAVARPLACQMRMTGAQLAAFEAFYDDDLAGGTLPFTFTHPRTAEAILVRFAPDRPPPDWSAGAGDSWIVNLSLEILP